MSKPLFDEDVDSGIYSKSFGHIQYVPNTTKVMSPDMTYNLDKYKQLIANITAADIPDDAKRMLRMAATRHIEFNYSMLADYYCQAPKEVQQLMEESGLVIVDFDDAMEYGFVKMNETLRAMRDEEDAQR